MPIYVLLVACDEMLRATAARLVGQATHHVAAVPDLDAALRTLSGIRFDVLVIGDLPMDTYCARFLADVRALQPDLRVVESRRIAGSAASNATGQGNAPAPLTLDALRSAFHLPSTRHYGHVRHAETGDAPDAAILAS